MMDGEATVSTERMEARLLRWGESGSGQTVTFQIHEDVHPFKGYASGDKGGQRFMLVVAPIDDSEEPVPTEAAKRKKPFHELSRAQQAGILCDDLGFQDWFGNSGCVPEDMLFRGSFRDEVTAAAVRWFCGVESRADLNINETALRKWDALVARYREETQMAEQR